MLIQRRVMRWRTRFLSLQAVLAHALLFIFTLLLALKLDRALPYSWWSIFFSFVAISCCCSTRQWAPTDTVIATPLIVAFELLLCIHLESSYGTWMCRTSIPGDEENISDEAIWENLPVAMIFFMAATIVTLLKLYVLQSALLFSFAKSCIIQQFTVILALENPVLLQYLLHILTGKEGTPPSARHFAFLVIFALLLLQGTGVLFAAYRLVEKISLLGHSGAAFGRYWNIVSKARDCLGFLQHGSMLLCWWSVDEGSGEELARLYCAEASGYNTFSPDIVKTLPTSDLIDESWRFQAALSEQTEITKINQQEFERLQNDKTLCRVCSEDHISIVRLPCSTCSEKCEECPICRLIIEE